MRQQQPSYMTPPVLYAWDLYADGEIPNPARASHQRSFRGGFGSAAFYPGMEAFMSPPAFEAFKGAMVQHCAQYRSRGAPFAYVLFFAAGFAFALSSVLPETELDLSGVPIGLIVVVSMILSVRVLMSRVDRHNAGVDDRVRAELARVNAALAGRAHVTLYVADHGLCARRAQNLQREARLSPGAEPTPTVLVPPAYAAPPSAPTPYYPQVAMASLPNVTTASETTTGDGTSAKEIFVVAVPEGVAGGAAFSATTPTGRVVRVTAPRNARPGLEFQAHA